MKTAFKLVLIALFAFILASEANADCVYGGKSYPTGTRVGNSTCQADGTWR